LWETNEQELLRLAVLSTPDREMHAQREDELLNEQDAIEFRFRFDATHLPSFTQMFREDGLEIGS
jgi:hypothetical protein